MKAKISELRKISLVNKIFCSPKISLRYFDAKKIISLPYRVSRLNMFLKFTPPRQPTEATTPTEATIGLPHRYKFFKNMLVKFIDFVNKILFGNQKNVTHRHF